MFSMNRITTPLFVLCLLVAWTWDTRTSYASTEAGLLQKADSCRQSLMDSGSRMRLRHNWEECLSQYQSVYDRYPKSPQAARAMYHSGRMYTELYRYSGREADLDEAIALFKRLTEDHPDHSLADDAQFRIGEIYYRHKKNLTQAYIEFLKVDIKYPSGDMKSQARAMMDELAAILSRDKEKKKPEDPEETRAGSARVTDIRHWSTPTYTRVVVDMERPVTYESHLLQKDPELDKPRRLYVDLKDSVVTDIKTSIPIRDGLLRQARAAQNRKDTVRVVLDIDNIEGYKIFHLYDPFRIVIDVKGSKIDDQSEKERIEELRKRAIRGVRRVDEPDHRVSLARQLGLSVGRVVIDPGHGGKDPGTIGPCGVMEKDIVLNLARILALKIERELGYEAILTREDDSFIPLERRTAFANMKKGDLFISLHTNAHRQAGIHGIETYFLNMATDERAVLVAARENATSEKNISDLQTILNDLMLNTRISESSKLAHEVQQGIIRRVGKSYQGVKSLGVKQAPFYVLIGAEMPAVLVEIGFITNPAERDRLTSNEYLETMADGIAQGIAEYVRSIELSLD